MGLIYGTVITARAQRAVCLSVCLSARAIIFTMREARHDRPPCGSGGCGAEKIHASSRARIHSAQFHLVLVVSQQSQVDVPLLSTRNLPLSLSSLLFQTSPTSRRTLKDARPCRSSTSHPIPFRGEKKMEGDSNLNQSATLGRPSGTGEDLHPVIGPSLSISNFLLSPLSHAPSSHSVHFQAAPGDNVVEESLCPRPQRHVADGPPGRFRMVR